MTDKDNMRFADLHPVQIAKILVRGYRAQGSLPVILNGSPPDAEGEAKQLYERVTSNATASMVLERSGLNIVFRNGCVVIATPAQFALVTDAKLHNIVAKVVKAREAFMQAAPPAEVQKAMEEAEALKQAGNLLN